MEIDRTTYRSIHIAFTFKLLVTTFETLKLKFLSPLRREREREREREITRGSYEKQYRIRYKVDTYYLLSGMLYIIFLLPYKYYIKLQSITESNLAHSHSRTHHMI